MSIWPPIVILMLMAIDFAVATVKAGEPRSPYSPGGTLFSMAVLGAILWWGGFFEPLVR